jgi:hypothetical protein
MKQRISKVSRAYFFPTAPSETGSSFTRSRSNCQSRLGVYDERTRLLQCISGQTPEVDHRPAAVSSKCSRQTQLVDCVRVIRH